MSQVDEIRAILDGLSGETEVRIRDLGEIGLVLTLTDVVDLLRAMRETTLEQAAYVAEEHAGVYNPDGAGYEAGYKSASVDIQQAILAMESDEREEPAEPGSTPGQ